MAKQKFLLHTCCAVCSGAVIQELLPNFEVVAYFFNPNIQPEEEYHKRKESIEKYCEKNSIQFINGQYLVDEWLEKVKALANEPEGGRRCLLCYEFRLSATAQKAKELNCHCFGSTLTISPHKKAEIINAIGKKIGFESNVLFYEADWKKQNGFQKALSISNQEGFYRQNYCGCLYSKGKKLRN